MSPHIIYVIMGITPQVSVPLCWCHTLIEVQEKVDLLNLQRTRYKTATPPARADDDLIDYGTFHYFYVITVADDFSTVK